MDYGELVKHRVANCGCDECRREAEFWQKLETEAATITAELADQPLEVIEKVLDQQITKLAEHMAVFGTRSLFEEQT